MDPPEAWTLAVAGPGLTPDLHATFLPGVPWGVGAAPVTEGALPLTLPDLSGKTPAPAGEVVLADTGRHGHVLAIGPGARATAERMKARLAGEGARGDPAPEPPEPGLRLIARFRLSKDRARQVLGSELEPGGLLMCLAGGDVTGEVWTDGRIVRLEARAAAAR
jgi:hypothetical protein